MQKTPAAGPIATRLVRAIQRIESARVVDLRAFREGMARATNMQKTVATRDVLADFHPVHAVYVAVQNQVSRRGPTAASKNAQQVKYEVVSGLVGGPPGMYSSYGASRDRKAGGPHRGALRDGEWGCYVIKPSAAVSLATAEAWLNKRLWQGW